MTKSVKDTAELFSSLRPEPSEDRAAARSSTQEAMARWPLLRSLMPGANSAIPALTAEEKASRIVTESASFVSPKRSLSVPRSDNKLEQSLAKMAARSRASALHAEMLNENSPADNPVSAATSVQSAPLNDNSATAARSISKVADPTTSTMRKQ
jgi:hypothetical protein